MWPRNPPRRWISDREILRPVEGFDHAVPTPGSLRAHRRPGRCRRRVRHVGCAGPGQESQVQDKKKKFEPPPPAQAKPDPANREVQAGAGRAGRPNFKPLPIPTTKDAAALAKLIDAEIAKKLAAAKITPSPMCTDDEFLRRAYLDITGVIPTAEKARAFLDDNDPDKRAKLIDELLADPNYGRRMADIWTAKLFPRDSDNRFVLKRAALQVVRGAVQQERSRGTSSSPNLVTATGNGRGEPGRHVLPREPLGRQADRHRRAALPRHPAAVCPVPQPPVHDAGSRPSTGAWPRSSRRCEPTTRRTRTRAATTPRSACTEGTGRTKQKDFLPESAKTVPAKFLGGPEPKLSASEPYRPVLAKWMTAPENPFFARAMVNRTWAQLFGRGFVNPVDDMHAGERAEPPGTARRARPAHRDDRRVRREVPDPGDLPQRDVPADEQADRGRTRPTPQLFSHMAMKVMSPEQLFDSLAQVTGNIGERDGPKRPKAADAPKGGPVGARASSSTSSWPGPRRPARPSTRPASRRRCG